MCRSLRMGAPNQRADTMFLLSKREVLRNVTMAGTLLASAKLAGQFFTANAFAAGNQQPEKTKEKHMAFTLPPLPYDKSALEPHISANTLEFHHDKHHQAYVNKTNELVEGTELEGKSLEDVILTAAKDPGKQGLFNQSAQVWNHSFYWNSMSPDGGGEPTGELAEKIKADFGSIEKFKEEFKNAGVTQFASGWAWLVLDGDTLKVMKTGNADLPMAHGKTAILTADVWEHAYYLDYQNRRPDYLSTFLDNLVNWEFAAENYEKAKRQAAA